MLVQRNLYYCLLVGLFLVGSLQLSGIAYAAEYYVDATLGSDSADGSIGTPWKTVDKVNKSTFNPGDRVKFKRGETFSDYGLMISNVSGTADNPVVFEAYDSGDLPIIDGGKTGRSWTTDGKIHFTSFSDTGANNEDPYLLLYNSEPRPPITTIRLDGTLPSKLIKDSVLIQLSPGYSSLWVQSTAGSTVSGYNLAQNKIEAGGSLSLRYVENLKEEALSGTLDVNAVITSGPEANAGLTGDGDWYWDKAAERIYLYSTVDPTPKVKVNWEADGIRVDSSSYVQVRNIKVQNFNKQGVVLYLSSNITVDGVEIYACGKTGIQMWDTSDNIIENNRIDSISGAISLWVDGNGTAENNQISNNTITNCFGACIGLTSHKVLNNTVSGNTISGANSMSYDGAGIYTFNAGSNLISSNTISYCGSIYLRSAGIMIDVASGASTAPMTIVGNTISNNSTAGIAISGASHRINQNTLTNNGMELMDGRAQIQFFTSGRPASYCTVTSNTIEASTDRQFLVADSSSTSGHYIDYNQYLGESSKQFSWAGDWMLFETWQNKTGHDCESVLNGPMPPIQPLKPPLLPPTILQFIPAILAGSACK